MRSWISHLGDRANPAALVDVINKNKKKVNAAILLRDEVKREFNLQYLHQETNPWSTSTQDAIVNNSRVMQCSVICLVGILGVLVWGSLRTRV